MLTTWLRVGLWAPGTFTRCCLSTWKERLLLRVWSSPRQGSGRGRVWSFCLAPTAWLGVIIWGQGAGTRGSWQT